MNADDLQRLYNYGYWANEQLLGVVSELTPEQFTRTVAESYGSVRNTLSITRVRDFVKRVRCPSTRHRSR